MTKYLDIAEGRSVKLLFYRQTSVELHIHVFGSFSDGKTLCYEKLAHMYAACYNRITYAAK